MVVKCTLILDVETEFDDEYSSENTVRHLVEQDLRDLGYDVDVAVLENSTYAKEKRDAYNHGYAEGYSNGYAEGRQDAEIEAQENLDAE